MHFNQSTSVRLNLDELSDTSKDTEYVLLLSIFHYGHNLRDDEWLKHIH